MVFCMRFSWIATISLVVNFVFLGPCVFGQHRDDFGYPYAPEKPLTGELHLLGSTLMQQLASLWSEDFQETHPDLQVVIDCKGSESSFPLWTSDRPTIGMFSRTVASDELIAAAKEQKRTLRSTTVAYDILAVVVHPENPIDALPWDSQHESLWNWGDKKPIGRWRDLGVEPPLGEQVIALQVPAVEHGLRSLAERFLVAGLASDQVVKHEVENPAGIADAVNRTSNAIALVSATQARTRKVKVLSIQRTSNRILSPLDESSVEQGYPLVRELTFVFSVDSQGNRHPIVDEFLNYTLSIRGQRIIHQDGFVPLERSTLDAQREKLGWEAIK
jgi:phosphate transport system substrate-binding protein